MTRKDLEMDEKLQPQESGTETEGMGSTGITVPGYQSQYAGQIGQLYDQISNRKPFEYNVNADAMYQALKDQYVANGQRAMLDTMGQAQAMTGGYGNSYAQGVGQQAYQGYLQGMTDLIPEYYQMALQNYLQEGDQMLQQYGMLQDLDAMDYNRYMDQMALVQPQVLEMLQSGVRPSQEMLAASGLSQEYVDALYPVNTGGGWSPPAVQGPGKVEEVLYGDAMITIYDLADAGATRNELYQAANDFGLPQDQVAGIINTIDMLHLGTGSIG